MKIYELKTDSTYRELVVILEFEDFDNIEIFRQLKGTRILTLLIPDKCKISKEIYKLLLPQIAVGDRIFSDIKYYMPEGTFI